MRPWVVNTSPLVYLAKLNRLHLLERAAPRLVIPPAVLAEAREHRDEATTRIEEACTGWLSVVPVKRRGRVDLLKLELGPGETEVLILAQELDASRVVLDDLEARRWARRLQIEVIGTLGLLLAANPTSTACAAKY